MIICQCNVITDGDIRRALLYLLNLPEPAVPTPGLVYRCLQQKFNCCSCAPVAVETIYKSMDELERQGLVCPYRCATSRQRLSRMTGRPKRSTAVSGDPSH